MISPGAGARVLIATRPVDFRKGADSLATLVKAAFGADPFSGMVYGDVGHPATIYHLIELLDFLAPADPARVFDLVAHALLGAGRQLGYQLESLGADRFVQIIGRFLADNRDIFVDDARRRKLITCLDAFNEVGWPAARRLLYRIPELLR